MNIDISEEAGVRYLHFGSSWIQGAMRIARPFALELDYTRIVAPIASRALGARVLVEPAYDTPAVEDLGKRELAEALRQDLGGTSLLRGVPGFQGLLLDEVLLRGGHLWRPSALAAVAHFVVRNYP